jgi:hypothetical protein
MSFDVCHAGGSARFDGRVLEVSTGLLVRHWTVCQQGLATILLRDERTGSDLVRSPDNTSPDWQLFALSDTANPSELTEATHEIVPASTFTCEHLLVSMYFRVPSQDLGIRYAISVYPGACGLRTELSCKALAPIQPGRYPSWLLESHSERLPLETSLTTRHLVGYYNDTQHRYHPDLSILKEETVTGVVGRCEVHDWANLIALENASGEGLALIKESHKCVNQTGIDTGNFKVYPDAVVSTGLGLKSHYGDPHWVSEDCYRPAWATWCLAYNGGELGRQQAVKEFDATRYPFRFERDALITSNTWGSRGAGQHSQAAANEKDVLVEIERAARLGIDCVQIDDGWQVEDGSNQPHAPSQGWYPAKSRFPDGWKTIKARARELGIKLGIWFPHFVPIEEMVANIRSGGFVQVKLDFVDASSREKLYAVYAKAKAISELGPDIQVNADLTEQSPRFGYYFGRTYCNLFPQNVEMCREGVMGTRHIAYTPHLTLRQSWHYAKYMNLRQLQISIQNIDDIAPEHSDASLHSHPYCFVIAMMGLPLFFLETKFYRDEAIGDLQPVIAAYRKHREEICKGMVYPIGVEPDNAGITGFQSHRDNGGYITAFRELHAPAASSIPAHFLSDKTIHLEDVMTGETQTIAVSGTGEIPVHLPTGASWQLLRYTIEVDKI